MCTHGDYRARIPGEIVTNLKGCVAVLKNLNSLINSITKIYHCFKETFCLQRPLESYCTRINLGLNSDSKLMKNKMAEENHAASIKGSL